MAFSGKQPENPNFVPTEKNDNAKTVGDSASAKRRAASGQQAGPRRKPTK